MVRDLKSAESETKAASILMQFNDRFDEVLAAINSTEKRLDGGSKCKLRKCSLLFPLVIGEFIITLILPVLTFLSISCKSDRVIIWRLVKVIF